MTEIKPFIWAQGQEANVREPIQALKETGWRYGDVPSASNFNWLFKTMMEEIAALRKDIGDQREDLLKLMSNQTHILENKLETKTGKLRTSLLKLYRRHLRASEFNTGISFQICFLLREMEKVIKHYHKDFPSQPWPLRNGDSGQQ